MRRRTFTATASVGAAAATAAIAAGTLSAWAGEDSDSKQTNGYTWKNAVINGGGFVSGIVFNETEPNLIYARTDIGGCYRWQEDSRTWKPLLDWVGRDKWGYSGVVSMATDPVETDRVYAAVGTYTNDWDPNNGAVLYSDDRGETWGIAELPFKQGGNMPGRGMGERLVVNPADNAELYLGTPNGNGLWRSKDHGRTWAAGRGVPEPRQLRRRARQHHPRRQPGRDLDRLRPDRRQGLCGRGRPGRPAVRLRRRRGDLAGRPRRGRSARRSRREPHLPRPVRGGRHQRVPVHRHQPRPGPRQRSRPLRATAERSCGSPPRPASGPMSPRPTTRAA